MAKDEENPFSTETKGYYKSQISDEVGRDNIGRAKSKEDPKPLPVQQPLTENKEKFMENGVPFLKEVKDHPTAKKIAKQNGVYVGSNFWHEFLIIFFVLTLIGGICFVGWGIYNDKFKTDVDVNLTCPEIVIPECPTIEIPKCPACENTCEVECPAFPNQIDVIIKNSTS